MEETQKDTIAGILEVLQSHARTIEQHTRALDRGLKVIRDDIRGIRAAQVQQNQLTAQIHQMYASLNCMAPPPEDDCPPPDDVDDWRMHSPSEEVRQLRALKGGGGEK